MTTVTILWLCGVPVMGPRRESTTSETIKCLTAYMNEGCLVIQDPAGKSGTRIIPAHTFAECWISTKQATP
jgi:hypothetical protein